jgi:hypothetical protein
MKRPLFVALALLLAPGSALAVTPADFLLEDGEDLIALCTVSADDPYREEAIHLCHGFAIGTYRTIGAMTRHKDLEPLFCAPNPGPTRDQAIAAFVAWARKNPEHQGDPPEEYIGRYLIVEFPCPKPGTAKTPSSK